ncbi:hypothetical protein SAMN05421858_3805 [Haladaptatus litoreus]|uniref:Uncharacterized protein n=1 Tax=Haladaptatus litoreus TaxID=553468 RepID=A0A1N7DWE4_9EURY|nr:hypothetical protein [Haladaptatus litoreus]SIR80169.1 hypothetical protein SAMN05421858_3805 [Haladaptatus litoreus]
MSRALLALVLALLLSTAGCSSFLGIDGRNPDSTPDTTTKSLSGELAPGLSADGLTNPSNLVDAHSRVLQDDSYTMRVRSVGKLDGNVSSRYNATEHRGENGSHYDLSVWHTMNSSSRANSTATYRGGAWSNGELRLSMQERNNSASYKRTSVGHLNPSQNRPPLYSQTRNQLQSLLLAVNVTNVERIDTNSGTLRYRVTASELTNPDALTPYYLDSVKNASLVFVVDTWGLIHQYEFEATGMADDRPARITESMRLSDIGRTTVSRPSWYERAMETGNSSRES